MRRSTIVIFVTFVFLALLVSANSIHASDIDSNSVTAVEHEPTTPKEFHIDFQSPPSLNQPSQQSFVIAQASKKGKKKTQEEAP
jgi:hypothetical protein